MPHSIGNMPRPRKMNPVHVMTRFDVSGLFVENMRIAVVCQQVCTENHSSVCHTRKVMPNFGFAIGLKPASPITVVDQYTNFDAAADTKDGVHANDMGSVKIATNWFTALTKAL